MNKAELIRKISKKNGIPDSEIKVFFELFLNRLAGVLKLGQALSLPDIGYFYYIQGNFGKDERQEFSSGNTEEVLDLIYYSPTRYQDSKKFDGFFFSVPFIEEDEYNVVDASFSLSFGKPLIPFKDTSDTGFYFPYSGSELRGLIESKVEKLIDTSNFTEEDSTLSEIVQINYVNLAADKQEELFQDDIKEIEIDEDTRENISIDSLSLDYDSELSKELEEQSIIDSAEDKGDSDKTEERFVWNFESFEDLRKLNKLKTSEQESLLTKPEEFIQENEEDLLTEILKSELESEKKSDKFERVSAIDVSSLEIGEEIKNEVTEEDVKIIELEAPGKVKQVDEKIKMDKREAERISKQKNRSKISLDEEKAKFQKRYKKNNTVTYIFLFITFIIITSAIYYYMMFVKGSSDTEPVSTTYNFNTDNAVRIERDFEFPVSYPYPKRVPKENLIDNVFDLKKEIAAPPVVEETVKEIVPPKEEIKKPVVPSAKNSITPTGKGQMVAANIFKYHDSYVVQVAAFRSESIALNEAGKFGNKGYVSFVEEAVVNGKTWFRVRVGNFSNFEEAKKFASQF